jgi:folate-dependent phosphoribosylglycinamide formyltransferase PurN
MKLEDLGCLLINSSRSKAYIQKMINHVLIPELVILFERDKTSKSSNMPTSSSSTEDLVHRAFQERKYFLYDPLLKNNAVILPHCSKPQKYATFNADETVAETLDKNRVNYITVRAPSINDPAIVKAIQNSTPAYFIFGGGGILRKPLLNAGRKFIHIHPGKVPFFKGSHCIEWSILKKEKCAVSAIFMSEGIDEGELIAQREFDNPELENNNIAPLYSAHIRSELLIDILKEYMRTGSFPATRQDTSVGTTYYKMHPALTNLVFCQLDE